MYQIYQVLTDENIESVANKFNTSVENLININGLEYPISLMPGNYLVVPKVDDDSFQTYIVKKGDNLYEIAKRFNTDITMLEMINGLKKEEYIYPDQKILVPSVGSYLYITVGGDTIETISSKTGISVQEILERNNQIYLEPEQIIIYKK